MRDAGFQQLCCVTQRMCPYCLYGKYCSIRQGQRFMCEVLGLLSTPSKQLASSFADLLVRRQTEKCWGESRDACSQPWPILSLKMPSSKEIPVHNTMNPLWYDLMRKETRQTNCTSNFKSFLSLKLLFLQVAPEALAGLHGLPSLGLEAMPPAADTDMKYYLIYI